MQWWNDFVDWFYSEDGQRILVSVVIPFVAIVVAGFVAALIGRGATRRLVAQRDHETRAAAVTALISAGQNAARWHSQSPAAREHAEKRGMVTLYDQFNRPIDFGLLREQQTARSLRLRQSFALHPSRGLTPGKLASILQSAERYDMASQLDLFEDMAGFREGVVQVFAHTG